MIVFHKEIETNLKSLNVRCSCSDCLREVIYRNKPQVSSVEFIQKPIKRTLDFKYNSVYGSMDGYHFISLPSLIFKINYLKLTDSFIIGIPKVSVIQNKSFYQLPLGNVYANNSICTGSSFRSLKFKDYNDICQKTISFFWQSQFNLGVNDCIINEGRCDWKVPIANPVEWEKRTKENPDWIPSSKDLKTNYSNQCFEFDKEKYDSFS